jgi:hypothetical protein
VSLRVAGRVPAVREFVNRHFDEAAKIRREQIAGEPEPKWLASIWEAEADEALRGEVLRMLRGYDCPGPRSLTGEDRSQGVLVYASRNPGETVVRVEPIDVAD